VPSFVATEFRGLRLVRAIRQRTTLLLVYGRAFTSGRMLVAVDLKGRVRYAFDFVNYGRVPAGSPAYQALVWAEEADGTLYVQTNSASPAKTSANGNAYVTAIKLANGKVLWRSPALVANARRFELFGDHVVTGYGFTQESDYLYLLDRKTGEPTAQLLIPTAADHIVRKGDVLYVRTYDHELVAKLTPA
jgi:outer membrane protein assembly factor BamB